MFCIKAKKIKDDVNVLNTSLTKVPVMVRPIFNWKQWSTSKYFATADSSCRPASHV